MSRNDGGNVEFSLNATFVLLIAMDCELARRDERRRPSVVVCVCCSFLFAVCCLFCVLFCLLLFISLFVLV